jgi:ubiquinone/menaquinone biosynthesis C-methylase UbiE
MDKISLIPRIKELYEQGTNIIEFLRSQTGANRNSLEDILISYDFQAGSYIKVAKTNPEYIQAYTSALAEILDGLGGISSIMEVGVGEATTLANLLPKIGSKPQAFGFDLSWSRIHCGIQYLKDCSVDARLFVGDLFNIPLPDNSVDVVYSSHSIEPNGGREVEALREVYRVTKKYLVLLEPTYEFADDEGKARFTRHAYITGLKDCILQLGYDLVLYKPFPVTINKLNPTGVYIIRKREEDNSNAVDGINYNCPISKAFLKEYNDHLFSDVSLISYPKVFGIPCLLSSYGILTSKHG